MVRGIGGRAARSTSTGRRWALRCEGLELARKSSPDDEGPERGAAA